MYQQLHACKYYSKVTPLSVIVNYSNTPLNKYALCENYVKLYVHVPEIYKLKLNYN